MKKTYRVQQACSFTCITQLLVIRNDRYTEQTHSIISMISLTQEEVLFGFSSRNTHCLRVYP
jgi:hypothetical protein